MILMMIITPQFSKDQKKNSFLRLVKRLFNKLAPFKTYSLITEKALSKNSTEERMITLYTEIGQFIKSALPTWVDIYS